MWKYMKRGMFVLGLCIMGSTASAIDQDWNTSTVINGVCVLTFKANLAENYAAIYTMGAAGYMTAGGGLIKDVFGGANVFAAPFDEATIAGCFGTDASNITNLKQTGFTNFVDVALADAAYIGFSFDYAGTSYEYAIYDDQIVAGATVPANDSVANGDINPIIPVANGDINPIIPVANGDINPIMKPRLQNMLGANVNMVKQAKTRFIASQKTSGNAMNFLPGRNSVPPTYDATLSADSTRITSRGNFFTQQGSYDGKSRQVVFGDFSVVGEKDGSVTGTLSSRIARERHISDQTMMGYFLGVEVSHTDIYSTFTGKNRGYDLIMGGYFVNELTDNVFVDGFVSVGTGNNLLEMSNDEMSLEGIYQTRSGSIGGALTGVYDMGTYEFWPELSFAVGKTKTLKKNFTETSSGNVNNNPTVDADDTTIAKLTVRPEMRRDLEDEYMSSGYTSQLTMAPRLICEWVTTDRRTQDCGSGAEVGLMRRSYDGLSQFTATISRDYVGSSGRTGLEFKFEKRF